MTTPESQEAPDWVPVEVARVAQMMLGMPNGRPPELATALIQRLLRDERMKVVWGEFNKRQRTTDYAKSKDNFYSSNLPPPIQSWAAMSQRFKQRAAEYSLFGDNVTAREYLARAEAVKGRDANIPRQPLTDDRKHGLVMATFFGSAVAFYCSGRESVTQKDLNREKQSFLKQGLAEHAAALSQHFQQPEMARLVVERRRTEARLEAFVEGLAQRNVEVFGLEFPGIIAITANVAFGRTDLDRRKIKAILRRRV